MAMSGAGREATERSSNFHLELGDGVLRPGGRVAAVHRIPERVNGLVDGAFRELSHPYQALFHLVQSFQGRSMTPSPHNYLQQDDERFLASLEMTEQYRRQPEAAGM